MYLLSIRIDGLKAGNLDYKINFVIPDREEVASTETKRGIFRYLNDELAEDAVVTVTMPKKVLSKIIIEGDINKWYTFLWLQDTIDKSFNIMTPVPK